MRAVSSAYANRSAAGSDAASVEVN